MVDILNLGIQEEATTPPPPKMQFTVKPDGEVNFKGTPNTDIIQQLMEGSEYLASSDRRIKQEIERERNRATDRINLLTICFLGSSFIVAIACFFWSYNSNQRDTNNVNREFVRRVCH